jgi:hypothetical protein
LTGLDPIKASFAAAAKRGLEVEEKNEEFREVVERVKGGK